MPTFRLTIEYDGTDFAGWQSQPGQRTIQGTLESALHVMLRERAALQGAGRTDAGVHASGQVASFSAATDLAPERFRQGLTALSRPDVAVVEASFAPEGFNARFDAVGKHYRYRVLGRRAPSPLLARTSWFVPHALDLEAMREAAAALVGRHDFRGFRAADCERRTTVREIFELSIGADGSGLLSIDVKGDAFLKNMVRIIAGTLVEVGRGRRPPSVVGRILEAGDRTLAGPTAPAHGLALVSVFYPEGWLRSRDRAEGTQKKPGPCSGQGPGSRGDP